MSLIVTTGKRIPYGRPIPGSKEAGPVLPEQPPRTFEQTTKYFSVSKASPGPTIGCHQPPRLYSSEGPPAACESPVKAWTRSTALSAASFSSPQVSYARVTSRRLPPSSGSKEPMRWWDLPCRAGAWLAPAPGSSVILGSNAASSRSRSTPSALCLTRNPLRRRGHLALPTSPRKRLSPPPAGLGTLRTVLPAAGCRGFSGPVPSTALDASSR